MWFRIGDEVKVTGEPYRLRSPNADAHLGERGTIERVERGHDLVTNDIWIRFENDETACYLESDVDLVSDNERHRREMLAADSVIEGLRKEKERATQEFFVLGFVAAMVIVVVALIAIRS